MQLSILLVYSTLATLSVAASLPVIEARQSTITVSSDTGDAQIEVPADVSAGGDIGGKADVAGAIAGVVNQAVQLVQKMIDGDIKKRQAFTQNTAARARAVTRQNIVVSNVGYNIDATDKTVVSTSYNAKIGSDVTFDVVAFKSPGTFTLQGDGGFENWAYVVDSTCTRNGGTITC